MCFAHAGNDFIDKANLNFISIHPNNRSFGMGNAFVALADDASATWWNPAGLANFESVEFLITHTGFPPNRLRSHYYCTQYNFSAVTIPIGKYGSIGIGGIRYVWEDFDRRHYLRSENAIRSKLNWSMSLSYGVKVHRNLSTGLTLKYIYSNLDPYGQGKFEVDNIAADFGLLFGEQITHSMRYSLGLAVQNIGADYTYTTSENSHSMPTNLKLGCVLSSVYGSLRSDVLIDLDGSLGIDKRKIQLGDLNSYFGCELWLKEIYGIRAGSWNNSENRPYPLTIGASIRIRSADQLNRIQVDISHFFLQLGGNRYWTGNHVYSLSYSHSV